MYARYDKIGRNFLAHEFTDSQTAARMGREVMPTRTQWSNVARLVDLVLDPLRDEIRRPIIVSSGVRPIWLNRAIGGARYSAHLTGRAADINAVGLSPRELATRIIQMALPFDKCILEFNQWVHVQVADVVAVHRSQVLTARVIHGETVYTEGLV